MRPQRFSCGIRIRPTQPFRWVPRFNEAAAFQLRNLTDSDGNIVQNARFNEAAAFQLRNPLPHAA